MTALAFPTGPLGLVLSRLKNLQKNATGWVGRCPAHNDGRPSLSVSEGRAGGVVLHCFAGCSYESICSALGLEPRDLAPTAGAAGPSSADRPVSSSSFNIVKTYDYVDVRGDLLFQVVRLDPKDFRQRRPDPSARDGWNWSMKGIDRVLYQLPRVLEAVRSKRVVFVVEGEKDADTLTKLGFVATTNPGGAKKWLPQFTDTLRGANVVLIPDNDKAGAGHADVVIGALRGDVGELRVMRVPAPNKDVTDWVSAGATADEIKSLATSTPVFDPATYTPPAKEEKHEKHEETRDEPPSTPPSGPSEPRAEFRFTDIGNGERLIHRHGNDLHYIPAWKSWMVWDTKRWQRDETHEVERRAKESVRSLYVEASRGDLTAIQKHDLTSWAVKSEADGRIGAMLSRARAEPGIAITTKQLDADPWLLVVDNGVLDLRTAELHQHRRSDLATKYVPIAYDPEARCDLWESFLARIMGENQTLIAWLQRAVGYALTGLTTEQCLFLLHGSGANGKTTFLEILRAIAGDYATQTDFTTFLEKRGDGPRNDIARLFNARLVTSSEVGEGKRLNESLVKSLTGGEMVSARFLYADLFEFMPTFKVFLAANHKPNIRGTDDGIWRRVRLIPFAVQIPPDQQDKDLKEKLREELPGILAWAVAGCRLWQRDGGLSIPDEVRAATAAYRAESDTLGAFLEATCEVGSPDLFAEPSSQLYAAYAQWCKEGGEFQLSQTAFGRRLDERGIPGAKRGTGVNHKMWRLGVKLTVRPSVAAGKPPHEPVDDRDGELPWEVG